MYFDDWRQQLFPDSVRGWAWVILGIVVLFGASSSWWTRIAGGVHPDERARARRPTSNLLGWLATLACPLILALGVGDLLFPLRPPRVLVLASRVRPDTSAWEDAWRSRFATVRRSGAVPLDVGSVIDRICHDLAERGDTLHFAQDSPRSVAAIRQVVQDHLVRHAPHLKPAIDVEATLHRDDAARRLPRWVVQSVEVTALKLASEQANVARVAAQFTDASGGSFPTAALRQLLTLDSSRWKPADVSQVEVLAGSSGVELSAVLAVRAPAGATAVDALVFSPGSDSPSMVLEVAGAGQRRSSARLDTTLPGGRSVQRFEFTPPLPVELLESAVANLASEPAVVRPVPRDPKALPPIGLLFTGAMASPFRDTFLRLRDETADPEIVRWRETLIRYGLDFNLNRFSDATGPANVLIECDAGSVTIRRPDPPGASAPAASPVTSIAEDRPIRGQTVRSATPGILSFQGLPLRRNAQLSRPDPVRFAATRVNVAFLGSPLNACSIPRQSPVYHLFQTPIFVASPSGSSPAFLLGVDFRDQGMLFDPTTTRPNERMFAGWTAIIEAAYRVRVQDLMAGEAEPEPNPPPILLVEDQAVQSLRSRRASTNALGLAAALVAVAVLIERGSRSARIRQT